MEQSLFVDLMTQAGRGDMERFSELLKQRPYMSMEVTEAAVMSGCVEEREMYEVLSAHYQLPLVNLAETVIDPADLLIAQEGARNYFVMPVRKEGPNLVVAMADPEDVVAEDAVRFVTGLKTRRVLATRSDIVAAIERNYNAPPISPMAQILDKLSPRDDLEIEKVEEEETPSEEDSDVGSGPIIKLVGFILSEAIAARASDIHVEPGENGLRVRFRVDGLLQHATDLPRKLHAATASRFKVIAGMDISEKRRPQDGRAQVRTPEGSVDLRVNILPTLHGEKVVLRILDRRRVLLDLEQFYFTARDLERFVQALGSSQGLILITGPTGSGKTSTLYAALRRRNSPHENLVTVEDPIEYQLDGINQVQLNHRAGVTFASALRAILRQDPDVVMVGEIRDAETAEIAITAAQTGHLVLSTLHTNDAPSAMVRLVQMGLPEYLVAPALRCVIAQRLVRRLCPNCKVEAPVTDAQKRTLLSYGAHVDDLRGWRADGCEACRFTGYQGRQGVFETLIVSDRLRDMLLRRVPQSELTKAAREEGMRSLLEDGLEKVAVGLTSVEEVLRVVTADVTGGRACPRCHRAMDEQFVVCPFCDEGAGGVCPTCSKPVEADWRTCPYCRFRLRTDVAPLEFAPQETSPAELLRADASTEPPPDILLVDDDEVLIDGLAAILELRGGYRVAMASDGREGLATAIKLRPRLIVSDISMPHMNGLEMVRRLRTHITTAFTPVILMTARPDQNSEIAGLEAGADDYVIKPVEADRLLARVGRVLSRAESMRG